MHGSTCTNCGEQLREGAQFCPGCGSAVVAVQAPTQSQTPSSAVLLVSPPSENACANCGSSLRERAQFCPGCGSAVVAVQAPAQSQTPSSAVSVMRAPTGASTTAPIEPAALSGPEPQSRVSRTPDSALKAASVPGMPAPPPHTQPVSTPVTMSPVDPPTPSKSAFRGRPRLHLDNRRVLAAGAGLVLLVAAAVLALALGSNSSKPAAAGPTHPTRPATVAPAASTPQPSAAPAGTTGASTDTTSSVQTTGQLASLDSILNLARSGRQSLANGDITAAIANRRSVLQELGALHPDPELSASVRALQAAERYSLQADTTCGLNCSASIDKRATQLKQAFLAIFNPVAMRHNTPAYTAGQI